MPIINLVQGSDAWLEYRQGRVMATDVSIIIESNTFRTPLELWEEKLGLRPPQKSNARMERGQTLEPEARAIASLEIGLEFEPCVFENETYPWAAASLDGLFFGLNRVLEIKCPKEQTHIESFEGVIQSYYMDQMQWQMLTCNSEVCYYFSYRPEFKKKPFHIIEVFPNHERQEILLDAAHDFYIKMCTMQPPVPWVFTA